MIAILFHLYNVFAKQLEKSTEPRSSMCKLVLPKTQHLILNDKNIQNRQIFIIGDVHGCYDELKDLLILANCEADRILPIFVGDIVNKGPHSVKTIRKVRELNAYAVRGNHEEKALMHYFNWRKRNVVIPEKYNWIKDLDEDEIHFLQELPYTILIPAKDAIIVHGGIVPGVYLENQNLTDFITMRSLQRNGDELIAAPSISLNEAWASLWSGPGHVYFGHDAARGLQQYPYATGLDTGCLYGGFLTGIFVDSKKILQIKAKRVYRTP